MPDTRTLPRIVVIEDDAVVAETLTLYLEHAGYSVVTAADGREGLALARQPGVALVILDLMIPGLSGQQVCRALRETSRVPILMLTARTSEDDRVAGLEMGADDYVPKPFSPREVVARVQALLRRAGEPDAPRPTLESLGPSADVLRAARSEIDRWSRQVRSRRTARHADADGAAPAGSAGASSWTDVHSRRTGRARIRSRLRRPRSHDRHAHHQSSPQTRRQRLQLRASSALARLDHPRLEPALRRTVHGIGYKLATAEDER